MDLTGYVASESYFYLKLRAEVINLRIWIGYLLELIFSFNILDLFFLIFITKLIDSVHVLKKRAIARFFAVFLSYMDKIPISR